HMGVRAVVVKSFARIHETNLKKQGVLALTFDNPADYDLVQEDDSVDVIANDLAPKKQVKLVLNHADGSKDEIMTNHTLNAAQIEWMRAGSALNKIREENAV
ncbi:MAG: aconitate hydratase, partial [Bacteroidota bacterium]